jgi:hypothetical protein
MLTNEQIETIANLAGKHAYESARLGAIQQNERESLHAELTTPNVGENPPAPLMPEIPPGAVVAFTPQPLVPQVIHRIPAGAIPPGTPRPLNARK